MTIVKTIELLHMFCEDHSDKEFEPDALQNSLLSFLHKKHKNVQKFSFNLTLAIQLGYIKVNPEAKSIIDAFDITESGAREVEKDQKWWRKFLQILVPAILTTLGGVIGVLIGLYV